MKVESYARDQIAKEREAQKNEFEKDLQKDLNAMEAKN